ncbi:beta-N-acetylhexosaminidase [Ohtaekwangia sp.]|uniref:beta-N-acetylhexosaminidase n=1 Tax=Ohtaekwangia sp. TaxID=2066019 RepID=UPI002FDF03E3
MQKITYAFMALLLFAACAKKEENKTAVVIPGIIPKPVLLTPGNDYIHWDQSVAIIAKSADEKNVGELLAEFLKSKNINATIAEFSDDKNKISLFTVEDSTLHKEGYKLAVDEKGVSIQANNGAGLFYGAQTLLQLIPENGKEIPFVTITDYPRFAYRGLHLDVGRHTFSPDFIKKYIDLLAHHKFNRFHWHLTEDQGWRIEIKKYPRLQEIGAYRKETAIGHAGTAQREGASFDGKRYGGYFTQDEVKDIVKYAADRYVTIIPEIELPGHALAALAAYPDLGCTGGPYQTATSWGVFDDVFCAGKEETFQFLEGVLDEVVELFPSQYIHIGGDECPKTKWEKCPHCQKRMKTEKLKNAHELQSYFIQRMEKYLNGKNRQIIGWDEILEGGLAPNATVMSWRGEEGGIAAARQNHDVIMTPGKWCYFDHYQDTTKSEPLAIGGYLPVKIVYSYEPVPSQLTAEEAKHVLGAQANVWTEYIPTSDHVEYMVYPRACAMAEVVWSPKESRDYTDFLTRMDTHFKRLDDWKVNYAKHIQKEIDSLNLATKK